jgi:Transposase DDE domain/Transposase domain (DUF772)
MHSLLQVLASFGRVLQGHLFPALESELGPLTDLQQKLVRTLAMLHLDGFVVVRHGRGRPPHDRGAIARAFVAKAIFNVPNTRALLDRLQNDSVLRRLCGWETAKEVPDESVFSRAFAEFARDRFAEHVHTALIERTQKERLIGHISRDATAIEARERPVPKPKTEAPQPEPRYRKGAKKKKSPEQMTRLERQCSGTMTPEQMIDELPRVCDVGCKTNSNGHKYVWIGYKLHLDVADGQIPISCVLTSASLHDSQVAVPLAELTAQRVTSLYDLMDNGYESDLIRQRSRELGHVPIIDAQKRGSQEPTMAPHEAVRFRERTAVERVYSRLKDEFGGQYVRVRGWAKVMTHLMFGILALTVDQILRLTPSP